MKEKSLPKPGLPEPGTVAAPDLGIPGNAEPMPKDDAKKSEPTVVNEEED